MSFGIYPISFTPLIYGGYPQSDSVKTKNNSAASPVDSSSSDIPIPELTTGSFHGLQTAFKSRWNKIKSNYPTVEDKGVNSTGATLAQTQLAKIASKVAKDMGTKGFCYSGVKHALWTAGIIKDYADMPAGNAPEAVKYFETHPEIFEEIKDVKPEEIKNLKAGSIVIFEKPGEIGHIGIANGNGQLYSDCTDPGTWYELKGGKEAGASYRIFKLKDSLELDKGTGKIKQPSSENKEAPHYLDSSI